MFRNRETAGILLARQLGGRPWHRPLVLAIPRGGVAVGASLARELGADLDVVLARKLRAPNRPELAVGAVTEDGRVVLNEEAVAALQVPDSYLAAERDRQLAENARRRDLFRRVRPPAPVADRSVIVVDDGIATGSTMLAALRALRAQGPREVVVAVPVAAPDRLDEIGVWCDEWVCLEVPPDLSAVGNYYQDFEQVTDEEVLALLHQFVPPPAAQ